MSNVHEIQRTETAVLVAKECDACERQEDNLPVARSTWAGVEVYPTEFSGDDPEFLDACSVACFWVVFSEALNTGYRVQKVAVRMPDTFARALRDDAKLIR